MAVFVAEYKALRHLIIIEVIKNELLVLIFAMNRSVYKLLFQFMRIIFQERSSPIHNPSELRVIVLHLFFFL